MQRLFQEDHKLYTENISDEEYYKRIFSNNGTCVSLVQYYDEIVDKILKENFELNKCPNKHIWYGEWKNHRRIVIKLYQFYSHEIRFGYNYDFIPRLTNQNKFVYHRTDKSVDLDVMDQYLNHITYDCEKLNQMETLNIRRNYTLPEFGTIEELDFTKTYIENVVKNNIEFMQCFYKNISTDEDTINFLTHTIEKGNRFEKYWYIWTKAFLYAKLQDINMAIKTMGEYYENIPENVTEKLEAVKKMFSV